MDIGPYVDYLLILVVVPIVILVVIIIAVEIFRAYYDSLGIKINELNSQIRFKLGQIEDQFKKIEEINEQNFVIDDPEPYGSGVQKLQEQLVQGRAQYTSQVTRRKKLAQQKFSPPTGRLVWILYYWQALHDRMKRHQQFRALQQIVESLETGELQEARKSLNKLQEYPTVVQQKIKDLQEINLDTMQLTKELYRSGLRGDIFNSVIRQVDELVTEINCLPDVFVQESGQPCKENVILVWEKLPALDISIRIQSQFIRDVYSRYQKASQIIQELQEVITEARGRYTDLTPLFDAGEIATELKNIVSVYEMIQKTYSAPTIGALTELEDRLPEVISNTEAVTKKIRELTQQYYDLGDVIADIIQIRDKTVRLMDEVAQAARYPLQWQRSQVFIAQLDQDVADINDSQKRRTVAQLQKDLKRSDALKTKVDDSYIIVVILCRQRNEFIEILDEMQLTGAKDWLHKAQNLYSQVKDYSTDNWCAYDNVENLVVDAQSLSEYQDRLIVEQSLTENKLSERLVDLKKFKTDLHDFQTCLLRIEQHLTELQEVKQAASEKLEVVCRVMELLDVPGIILLDTPAGFNYRQEINEIKTKGSYLRGKLNQPASNRVFEMAQQVDIIIDRCKRLVMEDLVQGVQINIDKVRDKLFDEIEILEKIAPFNGEGDVSKVREYSPGHHLFNLSIESGSLEDVAIKVENAIRELESMTQIYKNLFAQRKRLMVRKENVEIERQHCADNIEGLKHIQADYKTEWPPFTFKSEADMLWAHVETFRIELGAIGHDFDSVYQELGRLAEKYVEIRFQTAKMQDEVKAQKRILQDIGSRIERRYKQLQKHSQASNVGEDVTHKQLAAIEKVFENITCQPLRYIEVEQKLTELWGYVRQ